MTSNDTITTQSHWKTASFSCLALWVTSHEGQKSPMKRNTAPCLTYLTQHEIFPSASTLMQMKCFFFFFFFLHLNTERQIPHVPPSVGAKVKKRNTKSKSTTKKCLCAHDWWKYRFTKLLIYILNKFHHVFSNTDRGMECYFPPCAPGCVSTTSLPHWVPYLFSVFFFFL